MRMKNLVKSKQIPNSMMYLLCWCFFFIGTIRVTIFVSPLKYKKLVKSKYSHEKINNINNNKSSNHLFQYFFEDKSVEFDKAMVHWFCYKAQKLWDQLCLFGQTSKTKQKIIF